ncbi:Transthyretin-like family protein [Acanthocheilonema viteae]
MQSTRASGTLMCNGRPASGVLIKLYDDDRGFDTDDFMGETKTDSRGNFDISGHLREMSRIDPKINIYHDCNDEFKPCQRKVSITIPDTYITAGKTPRKSYNAGTLELAGKFPGETRDCIH